MLQESAEVIGLKALGWLVADEEMMGAFLGATGASAADLGAQAHDPDFLGSVLDFLLMNDDWVRAFCNTAGLGYEDPMRARQALPGGAPMHWT